MKIATNILDDPILKSEGNVAKMIIENLFTHKSNQHVKKHKLIVRKLLTRLIRRCGINYVTKIMPEFHRPMLAYIEKEKRRAINKKDKAKLLALMGEEAPTEQTIKEDGDSDSEVSSDEELTN